MSRLTSEAELRSILQHGFRRGTLMRQPPTVPIPYEECRTTSGKCCNSYESDLATAEANRSIFAELELRTHFELSIITNEVALLHFSDNEEDIMATSSIESTEGVYQKLLIWHDQAIARGLDPSTSVASWMILILQ